MHARGTHWRPESSSLWLDGRPLGSWLSTPYSPRFLCNVQCLEDGSIPDRDSETEDHHLLVSDCSASHRRHNCRVFVSR